MRADEPREAGGDAPAPPRSRAARALRSLGKGLALATVLVGSLAGSVLAHLDHAVTRALVHTIASDELSRLPTHGTITLGAVEGLSLDGLRVRDVTVRDPGGQEVLSSPRVDVELDLVALLRGPPERITVGAITVHELAVSLHPSERSGVTLPEAFEITAAPGPTPPKLRLELSKVRLDGARVRGEVHGGRRVDASIRELEGALVSERFVGTKLKLAVRGAALGPIGEDDRASALVPLGLTFDGVAELDAPDVSPVPTLTLELSSAVEGLPVAIVGRLSAGERGAPSVHLDVRAPRLEARRFVGLVPELAALGDLGLDARLRVEGTLPRLDASLELGARASGPALARVDATVVLGAEGAPPHVSAGVSLRDVSPRALAPVAPEGSVSLDASLEGTLGSPPRLTAAARVHPSTLAGHTIPGVDALAALDDGALRAELSIDEPTLPVRVAASWLAGALRFEASGTTSSLARLPRLASLGLTLPADAKAEVGVTGSLVGGELEAAARARLRDVRAAPGGPAVRLASAEVSAHVRGAVASPASLRYEVRAAGRGLAVDGQTFPRVSAGLTRGEAGLDARASLELDDGGQLDARAKLDLEARALRDVRVTAVRDGARATLRARTISTSKDGRVETEGLAAEGPKLGSLAGRLAVDRGELVGRLTSDRLDVDELGKLLGLPLRVGGVLALDVSLARAPGGRKGHAHVALEGGEIPFLPGLGGAVTARFDGARVVADAEVRLANGPDEAPPPEGEPSCAGVIVTARVSKASATLAGPLLSPATWRGAVGRADVAIDDARLACLLRRVPFGLAPLSQADGTLTARATVTRAASGDAKGRPPAFAIESLTARTKGLVLAGKKRFGQSEPDWRSSALDVELAGALDALGKAHLEARVFDAHLFAKGLLDATLDVASLLGAADERARALAKAPFSLRLEVPRRGLDELGALPSPVRESLPPVLGELSLVAEARGTLEAPTVEASVALFDVRPRERGERAGISLALDGAVRAKLEGREAKVTLEAHHVGRPEAGVLAGDATLTLPQRAGVGVVASGEVRLLGLPLEHVTSLAEVDVKGSASGELDVKNLVFAGARPEGLAAPALALTLDVPDLMLGPDARFRRAHVEARASRDDDGARALAKLELVGLDGGSAKLDGSLALSWQGPLPEPLASGPASLGVELERFSLAALTPAASQVVRKIDGKLSGSLKISRDAAGKGALVGSLTLRDGALHVPTLGQEIEGGTFVLVAKPDGEVTLDELALSSRGGRLTGKGRAQLDGLSLSTASLALSVLEREALPVALDGVSMGRLHGVIGAFAKREDDLYVVQVDVPTLTLDLPPSSSSNVASLDPHPTVVVRGPTGPDDDEAPERPLPLDLTVKLAKVRVRGSGIDLELASDPKAPLHVTGDDRRTSGRIVTSKGLVEVMSKRFDVERGLVELRADTPKNPYVNLVARWDAPDGTRVYVGYVGLLFPLDDEKLTLRATPAKSQQELMALLVLGPDLAQGTAGTETVGNTASRTAANVGGGLAAEQINALLRGMPALRGLSLRRLGADDDGTFTSTITFELNDKLAASATYTGAKGQTATAVSGAAGGTANQRTGSTMVSVDWRFLPKFLLRATFGWGDVMSSGLDLLWQYRY